MLPGGGELFLIILVVFLLFSGRELPKIARTLGRWSATMKKSMNDIRREFNRISIEEELKEATDVLEESHRNMGARPKVQDTEEQEDAPEDATAAESQADDVYKNVDQETENDLTVDEALEKIREDAKKKLEGRMGQGNSEEN